MDGFYDKFVSAIQDMVLDGSWTEVNMDVKPYLTNTMNEDCVVFTVRIPAAN